jgi:hypothetical protein
MRVLGAVGGSVRSPLKTAANRENAKRPRPSRQKTEYFYAPLLRPASYATLPRGLQWDYVEAPKDTRIDRPDLPVSKRTHGVIRTAKPLTLDVCRRFSLEPVKRSVIRGKS